MGIFICIYARLLCIQNWLLYEEALIIKNPSFSRKEMKDILLDIFIHFQEFVT